MSGTGPTPAEQHLGDRLAALVDGELKHDARERVLAHLATCPKCKAEADAQRRLKSAFATATPPPPSEGFLARLQGLPGCPGGDDDGPRGPFGGGGRFGEGVFPVMRHPSAGHKDSATGASPLDGFGFHPAVHGTSAALPGGQARPGFRIHDVGREADRSPWRARRFAFAAASAVSLAAIALGGTLPLDSGPETPFSAEGAGSSATPLDAGARADSAAAAASRRGSGGGALAVGGELPGSASPSGAPAVVPPSAVRPVLAAAVPSLPGTAPLTGHSFALPALNAAFPLLIRPTGFGPLLPAPPAGGTESEPVVPSVTASASPSLTEHVLPLSSRR